MASQAGVVVILEACAPILRSARQSHDLGGDPRRKLGLLQSIVGADESLSGLGARSVSPGMLSYDPGFTPWPVKIEPWKLRPDAPQDGSRPRKAKRVQAPPAAPVVAPIEQAKARPRDPFGLALPSWFGSSASSSGASSSSASPAPPEPVKAADHIAPEIRALMRPEETSTPTAKLPKGPRPRAEKILTLTYCYEKMEHEGGKYGCGLPWKHEGPHVCAIEGSRNRKAKRPLSL